MILLQNLDPAPLFEGVTVTHGMRYKLQMAAGEILLRPGCSFQPSQPGPAALPLIRGMSPASSSCISCTPLGGILTGKGILENVDGLLMFVKSVMGLEASSGIAVDAGV